jgi:hypothetical protein
VSGGEARAAGARGQRRTGFVWFELTRSPHSQQEINVHLRMTLTVVALDGTPLNGDGRSTSDQADSRSVAAQRTSWGMLWIRPVRAGGEPGSTGGSAR